MGGAWAREDFLLANSRVRNPGSEKSHIKREDKHHLRATAISISPGSDISLLGVPDLEFASKISSRPGPPIDSHPAALA